MSVRCWWAFSLGTEQSGMFSERNSYPCERIGEQKRQRRRCSGCITRLATLTTTGFILSTQPLCWKYHPICTVPQVHSKPLLIEQAYDYGRIFKSGSDVSIIGPYMTLGDLGARVTLVHGFRQPMFANIRSCHLHSSCCRIYLGPINDLPRQASHLGPVK